MNDNSNRPDSLETQDGLPEDGAILEDMGPYKLLQKIGEGGMGTVYLAQQENLCADVWL